MRMMRWNFVLLLLIESVFSFTGEAQQKFEYLSPIPNSTLVSRFSNIIIRQGAILKGDVEELTSALDVVGTRSGEHKGQTLLASDGKTILFTPEQPFVAGELVKVSIKGVIRTQSGGTVGPYEFAFTVSQNEASARVNYLDRLRSESDVPQSPLRPELHPDGVAQIPPMVRFLPSDFPSISVTTSGVTAPGDLFLSNFRFDNGANSPYLMILNNAGEPVYYQAMPGICLDFKIQPTGQLTYFDGENGVFQVMDSAFNIVNSYATGNGYITDLHEFRLMPNGHAFLLANDDQVVRMDTIVTGGNPAATVTGLIVQEVDEQKNVVFQWRSWDHFSITDSYVDLTASSIDYVHGNALEVDYDGNLLLSSRHLSEITKINRQTGAIMWRLGGKNNQFTFINDPTGFSFQHAVRRLENGDIVVFDNGNQRVPPYSRAVEYRVDENAKTATLVWEYRNTPDNFGYAMGYVQRLPNTSTLIGWGASNPSVTEVTPGGAKLYEMTLPDGVYSYRAYRYPWKDAILSVGVDTLDFGSAALQIGTARQVTITNLTSNNRTITAFATTDPEFTVLDSVPLTVPAKQSVSISVKFLPSHLGVITDVLDIRSDLGAQGIVEQLPLIGESMPPTIATSSSEMDFGNIVRGFSSTRILRLSNTSRNALLVDSAYTRSGLFTVSPNKLTVSDSGTISISFTPTVQGSFTDILYLENNTATPVLRIPLFASSFGLPIVDDDDVDFGPDPVQDSSVTSVWIHNTLSSSLTFVNVVGTDSVFSPEIQFPIVLPAHDSTKVDLRFDPPSFGQYIDTLLFVSDSADVAILASGSSPPPALAINQQIVDFGIVHTDSTRIKTVELRDSSVNSLSIDSIYVASRFFSINHPALPVILHQGDSLSVTMIFDPGATGAYADTLFILNDSPHAISKLAMVGTGSDVASVLADGSIPKTFTLGQNYPNPFNPSTTIPFGVPTRSRIRIEVYNILGQSVAKLADNEFQPGFYNVIWDGRAPSGVYLYAMEAVSLSNSKLINFRVMKMVLMK